MFDSNAVARAQMRIDVLQAAYREAMANVETAAKELRNAELPFPDGQQKYRNALVAESHALEAYMCAVRDFMILTRSDEPAQGDRE